MRILKTFRPLLLALGLLGVSPLHTYVEAQSPLVCTGEADGNPYVWNVCVPGMIFDGASVTDNGDGTVTVTPTAGSGDITDVFDCASGNCSSITMTAGDVLDTTSGTLELPQQTACNETTEGRICWDTNDDTLCVGSGSGCTVIGSGSGDITAVGDCSTGACFTTGGTGHILTFYNTLGNGTMTYDNSLGNLDMKWSTAGFVVGPTDSVRFYGAADSVFNFDGLDSGGSQHKLYFDLHQATNIWFGSSTASNIRFQGLGALFGADITPISNDGAGLGTTSLKWADLFLADGSVINLNSGDITLTHSSNLLTLGGGDLTVSGTVTSNLGFKSTQGSTGAGYLDLFEDSDNGTNRFRLIEVSARTTNATCILENDGSPIPDSCVGDGTDASGGSSAAYIILNPGSANITGTMALVGDATQGAQIDGSNGFKLLLDATTDEGFAHRFRLPDNWASHTDVKIMYAAESATSGTVEFEAAVMCQTAGDSETYTADGFAAIAVASDTVPGTARYPDTVTITLTDDSCSAGDMMTLFISTDSDDGTNDTATGDRAVLGIVYEYSI